MTGARLVAERRRLKLAWVRGDFKDEDADIYHRELERIRRELQLIPSPDELAQLQQAARQVASLRDIWDDAEEVDQRDLMHLMFRRITLDVAQSRFVLLYPTAPFIPLLRAVPLLQERELGVFVPVWPPEFAETLAYPQLAPLRQVPPEPVHLPFLPVWPWPEPAQQRISPALSDALKQRRQAGVAGAGLALAVPAPGVPEVQLDARKWPDITLRCLPLEAALQYAAETVSFLDTPLRVQEHPDREALITRVYEMLAEQSTWHWVDLMPVAMPAHWLFTYFPTTWTYVQSQYWTTAQIFNHLKKVGFHVVPREQTFYQGLRLGAALALAQQRPGILQLLNSDLYAQGLARLEAEIQAHGADTLIGSEVTLVEVLAFKGAPPPQGRRRRS